MSKRSNKSQNLITLLLTLAIIIVVNVLSDFVFTRIDLTADKRFTLSETTKKLLAGLKDQVFFKVYLEGDFPPGFRKLHDESRELLDEMNIYSDGRLDFEFIDPSAIADETQRIDLYRQLTQKGLFPTTLEEQGTDETSQKTIFPGAIVNYNSIELPVQLLKDQFGTPQEEMINNSIRNLEYEFASTIRKITTPVPPLITFLKGHHELDRNQTVDIMKVLGQYYAVDTVEINGRVDALKRTKLLIIAKPDSAITEKDKFIIDQYVMRGGKILWCIDATNASMDSLATNTEALALSKDLNIDDMLFRYGVRINPDIVMDLQAIAIPIMTTSYMGNQPVQKMLPWPFFPMAFPITSHPVVNNLNAVKTEFLSSIDTIRTAGVNKTILLTTSKYSRIVQVPVRISLDIMGQKPDFRQYRNSYVPIAVLMEGEFTSLYKNRIPPTLATDSSIGFREISNPTKMIVISDGDILKNTFSKNGKVYPLEYDRYNNQFYGNKNLLLNMIDFLIDETGLIALRSKEIKLRLLDKTVISENEIFIKIINIAAPLVLVLLFGLVKFIIRKRKYAA